MNAYFILLAVDEKDAAEYKSWFPKSPELAEALVRYVSPSRLEGLRFHGAYATHKARQHKDFERAFFTLRNSIALMGIPPRIL